MNTRIRPSHKFQRHPVILALDSNCEKSKRRPFRGRRKGHTDDKYSTSGHGDSGRTFPRSGPRDPAGSEILSSNILVSNQDCDSVDQDTLVVGGGGIEPKGKGGRW